MGPSIKKLFRSTQVLFPGAVDAKFALHDWIHRRSGRLFKKDFGGLRHFDLQGRLIVDVGANRGQSIRAFKNAAPGCRVIAFEPNRVLADRLTARYAGDPNVEIEPSALSDQPGELTLHIPFYRGFLFDGLATTDPKVDKWFDRDRFYFFNPAKVLIETFTVAARPLDSYELSPSLIKLHAQRAEVLILRGAEKTIVKHYCPIIIAAWAWAEEIAVLRALGYFPFGYVGGSFRADAIGEYTWFLLPRHLENLRRDRVSVE